MHMLSAIHPFANLSEQSAVLAIETMDLRISYLLANRSRLCDLEGLVSILTTVSSHDPLPLYHLLFPSSYLLGSLLHLEVYLTTCLVVYVRQVNGNAILRTKIPLCEFFRLPVTFQRFIELYT